MFIPALVLALHLLAALIWVGGMFFAYLILRPSLLGWEQRQALRLWRQVFERFFRWVWVAVVVVPRAKHYLAAYCWSGPPQCSSATSNPLANVFLCGGTAGGPVVGRCLEA